jgi:Ca2+-dependent lipid-binding protein
LAGSEVAKTRAIDNTLDPKWNDINYIVIYQSTLTQSVAKSDELRFEVLHASALSKKSLGMTKALKLSRWLSIMGIPGGPNVELTEEETVGLIHEWGSPFQQHGQVWKNLYREKKNCGSVRIDLTYYPVIQPDLKILDPFISQPSGVVTLTIFQAKELGSGQSGAVEVVGVMKGKELLKTPVRKRTVNPNWGTTYSFYVADVSKADISFSIMNKGEPIGECKLNVKKALKATDDWYKLFGGSGKIRIGVKFLITDSTHSTIPREKIRRFDPFSVVRISVLNATDLPVTAVELGKIDPYCKVFLQNRAVGATSVCESSNDPRWNETFYSVCYSQKEVLKMTVFDFKNLSKDKKLGMIELPLESFLEKNKSSVGEDLKITELSANKFEVLASLYSKEGVTEDDLNSTEEYERRGSTTNIVQSVAGILAGAAKVIGNTKQTGQVRLEIEISPLITKKDIAKVADLVGAEPKPASVPDEAKKDVIENLKSEEPKPFESLLDISLLETSM